MRPSVGYLKKVIEKMKANGKDADQIKAFQTKVQGYFTKVIGPNFKDYDFYAGESMDADGMYGNLKLQYLVRWKNKHRLTYVLQDYPSELPRGWHNAIYYGLERWFEGREGLGVAH